MHKPIQLTSSNFGIGNAERELLFNDLPSAAAMRPYMRWTSSEIKQKLEKEQNMVATLMLRERLNAELLARITSLSNASAKGIAYENRRRIISEFSEPEKPNDTGRSEVQGMCTETFLRYLLNLRCHD